MDFLLNRNADISGDANIDADVKVNVFDIMVLKRILTNFDEYSGFIKADGQILFDKNGRQYAI